MADKTLLRSLKLCSLFEFLATVFTLALVDKAGRRRFLLAGSIVMTISILILYTVTQSLPGRYHQEICENTQKRQTRHNNQMLFPSYMINSSCTYVFESKSTSKPFNKTVELSSQGIVTMAINKTPSIYEKKSTVLGITSPLIKDIHPTAASIVHTSKAVASTKTVSYDQNKAKVVCFYIPTSSSVQQGITTKNQSLSEKAKIEMPTVVKFVTVVSLMAFAGGYSAGYGPVGWLVLSEIFPTAIKGRAFAATTVLNWSSNLIVSLTMLDLIDSVGVSWTFFLYGFIGMLAILFIYKFVPETKNRSLEEINALFSSRKSVLEDCLCFSTNCSCIPTKHTFCCNHYNTISSSTAQDVALNDEDWEA